MFARVITAAVALTALTTALATAAHADPARRYDPTCHSAICRAVEAERHQLEDLFSRRSLFTARLDAALAPDTAPVRLAQTDTPDLAPR